MRMDDLGKRGFLEFRFGVAKSNKKWTKLDGKCQIVASALRECCPCGTIAEKVLKGRTAQWLMKSNLH